MSSINNNSGNVGGRGSGTIDTTQPDPSTLPTTQNQQLQTALPRVVLDTNDVQRDVNLLLQRAGLERSVDGAIVVKDTASVGRTDETKGLTSAEQVYGSGETQLKPPAPLRMEITPELRRGAETFARNIDVAFDEMLLKKSSAGMTATPAVAMPTSDNAVRGAQPRELTPTLERVSLRTTVDRPTPSPKATPADPGTATTGTGGTTAPTAADAANAAKALAGLTPDQFRQIAELSADVLLAAFLKININDPNNSVDTHNKLQEIMTELRQRGIADAKKQIENSEKLRKEAEAYAKQAQYISTVISVVMIVLTLVLAALTGGAAAVLVVAVLMVVGALIGGMIGGKDGAMTGISIGGAIGSFGAGAAATAAATAAKEGVMAAVKEILQNMLKAIVDAIKSIFSKMVASTAQTVAKQAAETAVQTVKEAVKESLEVAKQGIKEALEAGTMTAEEAASALQEIGTQAMQEGLSTAMDTVEQCVNEAVEAGKITAEEGAQIIQDATTQLAEQVGELGKTTAQSIIQTMKDAGINVTEDMANQVAQGVTQGIKSAGFTVTDSMATGIQTASDSAKLAPNTISQNTANLIKTGANAGGEVVKAGMNKTATEKMLEAQEAEIQAKRMRLIAEMAQNQIQEEGEIIKMIMESKNNMVDAVIKMMNAMFASSQKLMSAGMAK